MVNEPCNQQIPVQGFPYYNCEVTDGDLPEGIEINVRGYGGFPDFKYPVDFSGSSFTGTPTTSGTYTFTLKITPNEYYAEHQNYVNLIPVEELVQEFTLVVTETPEITTDTLPDATIFTMYPSEEDMGLTLEAKPGYPTNLNWNITEGSLPYGLVLDANGIIIGKPTDETPDTLTVGVYNFTVQVTNGANLTSSKPFTLTVNRPPQITPQMLSISKGKTYTKDDNIKIESDDAYPAEVTYGVNGSLPTDLELSADGYITGTVDDSVEAKQYGIIFTATNTAGTDYGAVKIDITQAPTITTTKTEYNTIIGEELKFYTEDGQITTGLQLNATPGYPETVNWSINENGLPNGLSIDPSTGLISGATRQTEKFTFTVRADNGKGDYDEKKFTITVKHDLLDLAQSLFQEWEEDHPIYTNRTDLNTAADVSVFDKDALIETLNGNDGCRFNVEESSDPYSEESVVRSGLANDAEHLKVYDLSFSSAENEPIITENLGGEVTVLFPYDDEMAAGWGTENPKIYYLDEETGEATPYDTELVTRTRNDGTERNYLKITTNHFSKFAMVDPKQTSNPGSNGGNPGTPSTGSNGGDSGTPSTGSNSGTSTSTSKSSSNKSKSSSSASSSDESSSDSESSDESSSGFEPSDEYNSDSESSSNSNPSEETKTPENSSLKLLAIIEIIVLAAGALIIIIRRKKIKAINN